MFPLKIFDLLLPLVIILVKLDLHVVIFIRVAWPGIYSPSDPHSLSYSSSSCSALKLAALTAASMDVFWSSWSGVGTGAGGLVVVWGDDCAV